MYKLIACDLDGTLIKSDRTISEENIKSIKEANDAGVLFVPTSGRGFLSIQVTAKALGVFNKKNQYIISYNGGVITENYQNKILLMKDMDHQVADKLYEEGLKRNLTIHVYTLDQVYIYHLSEEEKEFLNGRISYIEGSWQNLNFLKDQKILKILYENTNYEFLKKISEELSITLPYLAMSFSSKRYLEFNPENVTKGAGLVSLADYLHIPIEETIAIGDSLNDLSMIEKAGLGVGVNNASYDLVPHCDFITKNDYNHSAIKEVIDRFIFNKGN